MGTKSDSTFLSRPQSQNLKHTLGPWIARPYPESKNQRITITGATSPVAIAEIVPITMKGYDAVAEANGRLIAAAQELLEVAKETAQEPCSTQGLEDMEGGCCKSCRARAAVAKATGRAS